MATIAQTVNVAHALVITEERLFLTPTWQTMFDMPRTTVAAAQVAVRVSALAGRTPV